MPAVEKEKVSAVSSLTRPLQQRRRSGFTPAKREAFTLIEMLVVVLILGILLAVAVPLYLGAIKKSTINTVKVNMKAIAYAAQAYRVRYLAYPPAYTNPNKDGTGADGAFIGPNKYLSAVPHGPRGVYYSWGEDEGTFLVTASENGENLWGAKSGTDGKAYFRLATSNTGVQGGRFYVENGDPFD